MSPLTSLRFEVLQGPEALRAASAAAQCCFQHPDWVSAAAAARNRLHTLAVVRSRGANGFEALMTGGVHRRFGLPVFESMPMGGYGGWLTEWPLSLEEECQLNCAWLRRARWPLVVLTSVPGRVATLPDPGTRRWWPRRLRERLAPRRFVTHVLDLAADDAILLQRTRPKLRGCLRKADQLGFEFEVAGNALALARFHGWYSRGSQHWQQAAASLLPEGFFTALAASGTARVWLVRHQGQEVGAALFLLGRHEVQYQASGCLRIDSPLSVTEAVLWSAARHYRDHGFVAMNFGASEGLDGVAFFKEKFGALAVPYMRAGYLVPALMHCAAKPAFAGDEMPA